MKRFFILLAITILIMAQFSCSTYFGQNGASLGEAPLAIYGINDFGEVRLNEASDYYEVLIITDMPSAASYYYDSTKINITVSDVINFTLDTSMTSSSIDEDDETSFNIRFNPKSAGYFTATVTIKTETRKYEHYLFGRGI